MKKYRVEGGTAKFGPGQQLHLSEKQISRRRHNLKLPDNYKEGPADVEALKALEFKVGEEIGLPLLEKRLSDIMVPLGPAKTEAEKVAVQKSDKRKAAAKAAAADKGKPAPAAAAQ